MRKELAKKKLMGKRKSNKNRLLTILRRKIMVISSILLVIGFLFFIYQKNLSRIHDFFSKLNTWIIAHKNLPKKTIKKESHGVATNNTNDIPVHFEFYSVLPATHISPPSTTVQAANITVNVVDNALSEHIKNQQELPKKHLAKNSFKHKEN